MKFKTSSDRWKQLTRDFNEQCNRVGKYGQFTKSMRDAVANKELTPAPFEVDQLFEAYGLSLDLHSAVLIRVSQSRRYRDLTVYERPSGSLGIVVANRTCGFYSWFIPFV